MKYFSASLIALLMCVSQVSNAAAVKKIYAVTFVCSFAELGTLRADVDLKTKAVKVTSLKGEFQSYVDPDWKLVAHFDADGKALDDIELGRDVPQMVLVGGNADDSQFTLNVGYSFDGPTVATFIAHWDGLEGKQEAYQSSNCAELDWDSMQ